MTSGMIPPNSPGNSSLGDGHEQNSSSNKLEKSPFVGSMLPSWQTIASSVVPSWQGISNFTSGSYATAQQLTSDVTDLAQRKITQASNLASEGVYQVASKTMDLGKKGLVGGSYIASLGDSLARGLPGYSYLKEAILNKIGQIGVPAFITMDPSSFSLILPLLGNSKASEEILEGEALVIPQFPKKYIAQMEVHKEELKKFSRLMPIVIDKLTSVVIAMIKRKYTDKESLMSILKHFLPQSTLDILDGVSLSEILNDKDLDIRSYFHFYLLEAASNLQKQLGGGGSKSSSNSLLLPKLVQEFMTGYPKKLEAFTALSSEERKDPSKLNDLLPKFSVSTEDPYAGRGEVYNQYIKGQLSEGAIDSNAELTPHQYKLLLCKEFSRALLKVVLPERCDAIGEIPLYTRESLFVFLQETVLPTILMKVINSISNPEKFGSKLTIFLKKCNETFKEQISGVKGSSSKEKRPSIFRKNEASTTHIDDTKIEGGVELFEKVAKHFFPTLSKPLFFSMKVKQSIENLFAPSGINKDFNYKALEFLKSINLEVAVGVFFEGFLKGLDSLIETGELSEEENYHPEELKDEMIEFFHNKTLIEFSKSTGIPIGVLNAPFRAVSTIKESFKSVGATFSVESLKVKKEKWKRQSSEGEGSTGLYVLSQLTEVPIAILNTPSWFSSKVSIVSKAISDSLPQKRENPFLNRSVTYFNSKNSTLRDKADSFMEYMQLVPEKNLPKEAIEKEGKPLESSLFLEFTLFHTLAAAVSAVSEQKGLSDLKEKDKDVSSIAVNEGGRFASLRAVFSRSLSGIKFKKTEEFPKKTNEVVHANRHSKSSRYAQKKLQENRDLRGERRFSSWRQGSNRHC
jgi:hypothetical protein